MLIGLITIKFEINYCSNYLKVCFLARNLNVVFLDAKCF